MHSRAERRWRPSKQIISYDSAHKHHRVFTETDLVPFGRYRRGASKLPEGKTWNRSMLRSTFSPRKGCSSATSGSPSKWRTAQPHLCHHGRKEVDAALAGADELYLAIMAARAAQPACRHMSAKRRRDVILKFADVLQTRCRRAGPDRKHREGAALITAQLHFKAAVDQFRYVEAGRTNCTVRSSRHGRCPVSAMWSN